MGWDLHPWEEAEKEERFLHPGDSLIGRETGQGRKGHSEAQRRGHLDCGGRQDGDLHIRSHHHPEHPSLRLVSTGTAKGWGQEHRV